MNRHERRAKQSAFKKQVKKVIKSDEWGSWSDVHSNVFAHKFENGVKFFNNDIYSVQIFNDNGQIVAGIRRHDESSNIPWSHKQRIKNELFGTESTFVEVFPPASELVDQANLFWLWEMRHDANVFNLKNAIKKRD